MDENQEGYESLGRLVSTPLPAGEATSSLEQYLDLFQLGYITPWMRIARLANAYYLPMVPHLMEELSVLLTGGASNGCLVEHLPTLNLNNTGMILNPVLPENGTVTLLEDPGHGIQFDEEKLAKLQLA